MNYSALLNTIQQTHTALQKQAISAINRTLTLRNWLIGYYIVEFEQKGEDRAAYGERLLQTLAENLHVPGLSFRNLKLFRQFYQVYPQIGQTLSAQLDNTVFLLDDGPKIMEHTIGQTSAQLANVGVLPNVLINKLSFSHLVELLEIAEPLKRTFYEIECIKGTWSVRELRRQVNSPYYERSSLSRQPEKLAAIVAGKTETMAPADIVKQVYTFEFLELPAKDVVEEHDLETALLSHLQEFIIELGNGFCFEARQKKILIGDEYFFIDLVFYHRLLKCHVLIDLKVDAFNHVNAGQLKHLS